MIDRFLDWLAGQFANDFFAGGLALGLLGTAAAYVAGIIPMLRRFVIGRLITTIVIDSRSSVFECLVSWLHHHPYAARCRRLTVSRVNRDEDSSEGLRLRFSPAPGGHLLFHRGVALWLGRELSDQKVGGVMGRAEPLETFYLTALTRNREFLRTLLAEAVERHGRRAKDTLTVYGSDDYGEWRDIARIRKRPPLSVVLRAGVLEGMIEDARRFFAGATWYAERGIPWRRGYLLYGPPGTGKTSLIRAVASALDLDIALVSVASGRLDDIRLSGLMAGAPERSVLVLEDIDAVFHQRQAGEAASAVTFSGLLNAIDGVASQEGHLLFMTTNHPERLDPALVRPGRADVRIGTGLADAEMAERMFLLFFPGEAALARNFADAVGPLDLSPAMIQAYFLRHRDDPRAAIAAVSELGAETAPPKITKYPLELVDKGA